MTTTKSHTVELRGSLGIRDAAGLAATLLAAIETHPAIVLAADRLIDIDISVLQVLVAAHRAAGKAGRTLTLKAPADGALRQTLLRAGFVNAAGEPLTGEGQFWTGAARAKGRAA